MGMSRAGYNLLTEPVAYLRAAAVGAFYKRLVLPFAPEPPPLDPARPPLDMNVPAGIFLFTCQESGSSLESLHRQGKHPLFGGKEIQSWQMKRRRQLVVSGIQPQRCRIQMNFFSRSWQFCLLIIKQTVDLVGDDGCCRGRKITEYNNTDLVVRDAKDERKKSGNGTSMFDDLFVILINNLPSIAIVCFIRSESFLKQGLTDDAI